jgi:hypothetical protein
VERRLMTVLKIRGFRGGNNKRGSEAGLWGLSIPETWVLNQLVWMGERINIEVYSTPSVYLHYTAREWR